RHPGESLRDALRAAAHARTLRGVQPDAVRWRARHGSRARDQPARQGLRRLAGLSHSGPGPIIVSEPPMTILKRLAVTAALLCVASIAMAAYPERPITMIVAYPPGGGTDLVARAVAPFVEKYLGSGAKIVVVNRAGAGGEVGFAALANSVPDGYTIGFVNTPPLLTIPIERAAQFHWQRYEYVGNIIDDPC